MSTSSTSAATSESGTVDGGGTVCVLDVCVADGDGVCLNPEDADAVVVLAHAGDHESTLQ
jgi:hypothetical protein